MSQELEQISFTFDDYEKVITQLLENYLGPKQYDQKEVPTWINYINETIITKLTQNQRPFKFLVNTLIMQRKGANVVTLHNNFWDTTFDSGLVLIWPKQKPGKSQQSKQTIQCMVSVYALSVLNGMSYAKNQF